MILWMKEIKREFIPSYSCPQLIEQLDTYYAVKSAIDTCNVKITREDSYYEIDHIVLTRSNESSSKT